MLAHGPFFSPISSFCWTRVIVALLRPLAERLLPLDLELAMPALQSPDLRTVAVRLGLAELPCPEVPLNHRQPLHSSDNADRYRTYREELVDLLERAALELGQAEDEKQERKDGEAHEHEAQPRSERDDRPSLEVRDVEHRDERKDDIGDRRPGEHLLPELRPANLRCDEVTLRGDAELAHPVQHDDGGDDGVGFRSVGSGVCLGSDGCDQAGKECRSQSAEVAERSTADHVRQRDGGEAADEADDGDEDRVGEGLDVAQPDRPEETDGGVSSMTSKRFLRAGLGDSRWSVRVGKLLTRSLVEEECHGSDLRCQLDRIHDQRQIGLTTHDGSTQMGLLDQIDPSALSHLPGLLQCHLHSIRLGHGQALINVVLRSDLVQSLDSLVLDSSLQLPVEGYMVKSSTVLTFRPR